MQKKTAGTKFGQVLNALRHLRNNHDLEGQEEGVGSMCAQRLTASEE